MTLRNMVLAGALGCFLAAGVAVAAGPEKGPATIKIDTNKAKKSVAAFPHAKHQELAPLKGKCITCHHKEKAGEKVQACGTCHTQATAKDEKTGAPGFMSAFHKTCQDCHKKQADKPALKECKTCHGG